MKRKKIYVKLLSLGKGKPQWEQNFCRVHKSSLLASKDEKNAKRKQIPIIKINIVLVGWDIFSHYIRVHFDVWKNMKKKTFSLYMCCCCFAVSFSFGFICHGTHRVSKSSWKRVFLSIAICLSNHHVAKQVENQNEIRENCLKTSHNWTNLEYGLYCRSSSTAKVSYFFSSHEKCTI